MKQEIMPITTARKDIFKLVEALQAPGSSCILTIDGKPQAVILSYQEYNKKSRGYKGNLLLKDESKGKYKVKDRGRKKK